MPNRRPRRTFQPKRLPKIQSFITKALQIIGLGFGGCLVLAVGLVIFSVNFSNWKKLDRVGTILITDSNEYFLSVYRSTEKEWVLIKLPNQITVPLVFGYGPYRLEVVSDLAAQEQLGDGLLERSLTYWWGVPVSSTWRGVHNPETNFRNAVFSHLTAQVNTSIFNRIWYVWSLLGTKHRDITVINLSEYVYSTQSKAEVSDLDILTIVTEHIQNPTLIRAGVGVAVVNTTASGGLARQAADVLTLAGYDVVNIESEKNEQLEQTQILVDEELRAFPKLYQPLSGIFGVTPEITEGIQDKYRALVVLKVGSSYQKFILGE